MSDIHLGSKWSKAREANRFLKYHTCDTLILCGDVIDGWELLRGRREKWKRRHTNFIRRLLDIQHDTHIIYLRGNHDDFLDRILPMRFANITLLRDYIYVSGGRRYYVLHGDVFDHVTSSMRWLAKVGDVGYSLLMWFNRLYNRRRLRRGLPYYSVSQRIKQKVKVSVSYISDFEEHLVRVAAQKGCSGVICGHIHQADKRMVGDILYLNSGDWVESLTALAEDYDGNWSILRYDAEEQERTMRYLFSIQGEGRGHLTQALSLAAMLRRHGHQVVGVLVGRSSVRRLPDFFFERIGAPVTEFEAPRFAFDHANRSVSMLRTLLLNAAPARLAAYDRSMRLIRDRIAELKPDHIVNFYELLTGLALRRFAIRVPMTGVAHQFLLNHANYPYGRGRGVEGWLLRLHARMTAWGCDRLLALSFRPMVEDCRHRIRVVPPLLRREALTGDSSDGGFILGYMVNNGFADELCRWSDCHPDQRLHVFWDRRDRPETWQSGAGLTFHRLDDRLFLECMRRCRAYVTTAGFESVCEAMYHRKPMLLVPAHIEQRINAADAVASGAGIEAAGFDLDRLVDYLARRGAATGDDRFRAWVDSAEERFIELLTH